MTHLSDLRRWCWRQRHSCYHSLSPKSWKGCDTHCNLSACRFGALDIQSSQVKSFKEKPRGDGALINGGFFVLSPKVLSYLKVDETLWEQEPLMQLAEHGELMAHPHYCFWQPMDTVHDKNTLEKLWASGAASWKKWD
jgi:glucose-1-phosphate cytidylyltransferase